MRKHYVIDVETKLPEEVIDKYVQALVNTMRRDFAGEDKTARIGVGVVTDKKEDKNNG